MSANLAIALAGLAATVLAFPEWFEHPLPIVWGSGCALVGITAFGQRP